MELESEKSFDLGSSGRDPRESLFKPGNPSDPGTGRLLGGDSSLRAKTSTRIFYEAQVEVIKKQLGSLENIRLNLGLSQRKIAQLLLVDPSAWTRWNRHGEEAPPHIWRALQWYMVMNEKLPGLTPQYFIGKNPRVLHEKTLDLLTSEQSRRERLESDFAVFQRTQAELQDRLLRNLHFHRRLSYFFAGLMVAVVVYLAIRA